MPEFGLSIPVVIFLVAVFRKLLPEWDSRIWAWIAMGTALGVAALSKLVGVLSCPWPAAIVNGLLVGGGAILGYDGLAKPLVAQMAGRK